MRTQDNAKEVVAKLDEIASLLKHLLALELYRSGAPKAEIGRHLRVAKTSVIKMLKGIKDE